MNIPFLDLKSQNKILEKEINESIKKVIKNSAFSSGKFVEEFEVEFSKFCKSKYCVGVNSGTSALHLALLAHNVLPGDEVITVPNSFIATTWAITYCGAIPVFVDVDPKTMLMNPKLIEEKITSKTKAIIPVHLYGQPAEMSSINRIAEKYNLIVIEDSAQAHGSVYNEQITGSGNNTACFSFYPGKNLGAFGEAGAVTTNNELVKEKIMLLRNHYQPERYHHTGIGYNYRMDGIQGAILSVKLKKLGAWTKSRNALANVYSNKLSNLDFIQIPYVKENVISSYHLYVIHLENRDDLLYFLNSKGISCGLHYPIPIHLQNAYKSLGYRKGDFPISEKSSETCLSLPLYPELSLKNLNYIVDNIKKYN